MLSYQFIKKKKKLRHRGEQWLIQENTHSFKDNVYTTKKGKVENKVVYQLNKNYNVEKHPKLVLKKNKKNKGEMVNMVKWLFLPYLHPRFWEGSIKIMDIK